MQHDLDRALQCIRDACFGSPIVRANSRAAGLEPFQQDAVERLRTIIEHRGGAILADSVGLGKTHVARALIREQVAAGGSVLVTGPAALRTHWNRHLRGVPRWRWVSHTSMSRMGRRPAPATLVVVDEAHAFRNPATKRYAALAAACEHARVLLLTATPVNNSLLDFHALVHLFASDDAFIDIGVPSLTGAVEVAARGGSTAGIRRVTAAMLVRRTRAIVSAWGPARLRFPQPAVVERLHYDPHAPELAALLHDVVPALAFPAHATCAEAGVRELMRLGLLKRLESGWWPFTASLRRHIRLLECFIDAANAGLLFDARMHATHITTVDGAVQLALDPLVLPPWPPSLDRAALVRDAERDLHALRMIRDILPDDPARDPKLALLLELLDGELRDETVLLFTEYRDTAVGLWRSLARRGGVALIHGSGARLGRARAARSTIIERFAPRASGARPVRATERVGLLIATDVLAEGLNLQDARVVISYDLPWNPVRLAQRIGRIDRLGSPHDRIRALAFVPDRDLDSLLGLFQRIRRKLRHIRLVGGDAPAFRSARTARRIAGELDAAAAIRETLRAQHHMRSVDAGQGSDAAAVACGTETSHTSGSARRTGSARTSTSVERPVVAAVQWNGSHEAALCCFRLAGGGAVLVLVGEEMHASIDSAAAWSALDTAMTATAATYESPKVLDYERAARRALTVSRATNSRRRQTEIAARGVTNWLNARPGGPTPDEADIADRVLRMIATRPRAGTALRLDQLLRTGNVDSRELRALITATDARSVRRVDAELAPVLIAMIVFVPCRSNVGSGERGVGV